MPKYKASYTVVKSFESQVVFEAPNDDAAAEMARDGSQFGYPHVKLIHDGKERVAGNLVKYVEPPWVSDSSMVSATFLYRIEPADENSVPGRYIHYDCWNQCERTEV